MIVDILKQVQEGFYCLTDNAGLSIIAVGFFVALLLSPLYYISQVFQQHDILLQNKMRKDLININKLENKREKHFYTNHIYKKHNYSPRYQFGSLIATIGQIPFLIAGIKLFNKNLSFYNVKFGFINNLSLPDGMIKISEYNVNILPIILFTLAISQINWNDYNKTNKIIQLIIATTYFVIFYTSPSSVVVFCIIIWLSNTIIKLYVKKQTLNHEKSIIEIIKYYNIANSYKIKIIAIVLLFYIYCYNHWVVAIISCTILTLLYSLIVYLFKQSKPILTIISIILFIFFITLYDELFIYGLSNLLDLRLRYILFALSFVLCVFSIIYKNKQKLKYTYLVLLNIIIASNLIYKLLPGIIRNINYIPHFTQNETVKSPVSKFVFFEKIKKKNILLICLDGYPSPNLLHTKYNLHSQLNQTLSSFKKVSYSSRYISTPISLSNLLFDLDFEGNCKLHSYQNEIKLFHTAYENSPIFPLGDHYDEFWYTLLSKNESSINLGFSFWGNQGSNAMLHNFISKHYLKKSDPKVDLINSYNKNVLEAFSKNIKSTTTPHSKSFYFLHFLTFHHSGNTLQEQINYADQIVRNTLKLIPPDFSVVFFSDHGWRSPDLTLTEMQSGIYYERKN